MLAKDAGKRDRCKIGFPTMQLEKEVTLTCVPYNVPHTLRWPRGTEIFLLTFFGPVAELARAKCRTAK
jgi:hypothetical protein